MTDLEVRQVLSANLRRLRKQRGLSQLKLANELQMAMTFINDIENCKKWVSPETLAKFATFYNMPISEFFATDAEQMPATPVNVPLLFETLTSELNDTLEAVKSRFL